ncbi:hypothetical protein P9695_14910 [Weizmannia sp. CD-2023]|uniref:hypothetical protein n=1 Tax=Weizmannia sp. CD-2023 TaxID=3037263 RepID=UPI002E20DCF5|nr:hypothetical protein [Weizmannia sp. CD-2023]MED4899788.1 hypothetical protein [Weizmannia sp. CD-2023]
MDYRMDSRTKEQFIQDIKRGNLREQKAIQLFQDYLYWQHGWIEPIKENGIDMSGAFIEHTEEVTTQADYVLGGMPLEVKTCPNHTPIIYLKVEQVSSYIKQGASLLFVNGIETFEPAFTLLSANDLKEIARTHRKAFPRNGVNGGKICFETFTHEFGWSTFEGRKKHYGRRWNCANRGNAVRKRYHWKNSY